MTSRKRWPAPTLPDFQHPTKRWPRLSPVQGRISSASIASSRPMPSCVPRSFHPHGAKQAIFLCLAFLGLASRACRSTPIPPQPTTPRRPCRGTRAPKRGPVAHKTARSGFERRSRSAGRKPGRAFVSGYSISTSSSARSVQRHLDDPRCHRRSRRDRPDPHPSRLVRPGTAPIARAVIPSLGRQPGPMPGPGFRSMPMA